MHRFVPCTRFPAFPASGEAHVWTVDLAADPPEAGEPVLSAAEGTRAARFAFGRDRRRFVRSRLALRGVLAGYLGGRPGDIEIAVDERGKPYVPNAPIAFNLSHAGETALVAVSGAPGVGVDIEERTGRANLRELCGVVLSPQERGDFERLSDDDLAGPFFALWTRKEAVLKALGTGLLRDPRTLTVDAQGPRRIAGPDAPPVEVATIDDDGTQVAALAVVGGFDRVRLLRWPAAHIPDPHERRELAPPAAQW